MQLGEHSRHVKANAKEKAKAKAKAKAKEATARAAKPRTATSGLDITSSAQSASGKDRRKDPSYARTARRISGNDTTSRAAREPQTNPRMTHTTSTRSR